MKKLTYFLLATIVCFSLSFVSCSSNNPDDGLEIPPPDPVDNSEILAFPFSTLTPEAQKEKLQSSANTFLVAIDNLKNNDCIKTLKALNGLLEMYSVEVEGYSSFKSSNDIITYYVYLKDFHKKYTWNSQTASWDIADANNQMEVYFPVGKQAGKIIVTAVSSGVKFEVGDYDEYYDEGGIIYFEIPKQFTAKIYLDNKEVGSVFAESNIVNDKTVPSLTSLQYVMGEYSVTTSAAKGTPNIISSTLKKGSQVLIDATTDLTANVDNALNGKDPGAMKENLIIRIMDNLAIAGNMDVDKYNAAMIKADKIYDENKPWNELEKAYYEASAKAFNDNTNLFIASLSEKAKYARVIQTAKEYTETWGYNTYTYWEEGYAFEFSDKSKIDVEVYFSTGFNNFMKNLNDFLKNFQ